MNNISSLIISTCAPLPLCFVGGWLLDKLDIQICELAFKYFGIPRYYTRGQNFEVVNLYWFEQYQKLAIQKNMSLDRYLGKFYLISILRVIKEELIFRCLIVKILSKISLQFADVSITRTIIINSYFAVIHVIDPKDDIRWRRAMIIKCFVLGIIYSVAYEKIGLLASIFLHLGHNFSVYYAITRYSLSGLPKQIKAIERSDLTETFYQIIVKDSIWYGWTLFYLARASIKICAKAKDCLIK